jgi:hypothetical protein
VTRCASELALEAHLFDPARSRVRTHVASCGNCRSRLARMQHEGEEFRRYVEPRTIDRVVTRVEAPAARGLGRLLHLLVPAGGFAAAAAALLLLSPRPPADYLGAKGAPLALQVFVGSAEGVRELADGESVPAGSLLRFRVASGQPCRLWLLSADAQGAVSRLYPPEGDAPAAVSGGATLPGGVALDGQAGPERLYAVCSPEPLPLATVLGATRSAAAGGEDALRRSPRLAGLPPAAAQATLLVEKLP